MSSPISPEFKLLCSLLPVHFRGELPWPDTWAGVDPAAFFGYVLKTQVAPLALHHWETRCPALWAATPFETRARIVAWQELFHHKQVARFASWRELLAAFAAADLPVIPLKGFVLSHHLYADPFRRHSSDFDLLIRRADFAAADALLRGELGCRRVKWHGPRAACEAGYTRAGADPEGAWNVDLHWDVVPHWHFLWRPFEGAWDHAISFSPQRHEEHEGSDSSERNREHEGPDSPQRHREHRADPTTVQTPTECQPNQDGPVVLQKQKESSLCPLCLCGESANPQSANPRTGEPAAGQSVDLQKQQESSLRPLRLRGDSSELQSANLRTGEPANGQSADLQKQQEPSLRPLRLCGESSTPDLLTPHSSLLTLSPADTAWFALVNNVSDYGLGNLRGCVEALELLALLDAAEADRFRAMAREGHVGRALAALEAFRARFFPGSAAGAVARLAPARRLAAARHFADERLYISFGSNGHAAGASTNGSAPHRAPLSQRAAVRLALAGPGPRFARFCAGKLYEAWKIREAGRSEE
ncbi:MAG TPA: nucleotidyltransferase family protein [Acidobacteriota bacterium]|nr:nucleotidyltransferase family protein [Acidobacteriota bacterium]